MLRAAADTRALVVEMAMRGLGEIERLTRCAEPDVAVLFARLETLDPLAASRSDKSNRRRIERALEVCIGSGQPFSSFGPGTGAYPPSDVQQIGIAWPRKTLSQRIEHRVALGAQHRHAQFQVGLVDAVAATGGACRQVGGGTGLRKCIRDEAAVLAAALGPHGEAQLTGGQAGKAAAEVGEPAVFTGVIVGFLRPNQQAIGDGKVGVNS